MRLLAIICGLTLCFAGQASSEEQMKFDTSGKGAVLCGHAILSAAYQFALSCRPSESEKIESLADSLGHYEAFISRNGNISLDNARRYTDRARQDVLTKGISMSAATCADIAADTDFLAEIVDNLTIEVLRDSTRETLSVDREPLMNPCL